MTSFIRKLGNIFSSPNKDGSSSEGDVSGDSATRAHEAGSESPEISGSELEDSVNISPARSPGGSINVEVKRELIDEYMQSSEYRNHQQSSPENIAETIQHPESEIHESESETSSTYQDAPSPTSHDVMKEGVHDPDVTVEGGGFDVVITKARVFPIATPIKKEMVDDYLNSAEYQLFMKIQRKDGNEALNVEPSPSTSQASGDNEENDPHVSSSVVRSAQNTPEPSPQQSASCVPEVELPGQSSLLTAREAMEVDEPSISTELVTCVSTMTQGEKQVLSSTSQPMRDAGEIRPAERRLGELQAKPSLTRMLPLSAGTDVPVSTQEPGDQVGRQTNGPTGAAACNLAIPGPSSVNVATQSQPASYMSSTDRLSSVINAAFSAIPASSTRQNELQGTRIDDRGEPLPIDTRGNDRAASLPTSSSSEQPTHAVAGKEQGLIEIVPLGEDSRQSGSSDIGSPSYQEPCTESFVPPNREVKQELLDSYHITSSIENTERTEDESMNTEVQNVNTGKQSVKTGEQIVKTMAQSVKIGEKRRRDKVSGIETNEESPSKKRVIISHEVVEKVTIDLTMDDDEDSDEEERAGLSQEHEEKEAVSAFSSVKKETRTEAAGEMKTEERFTEANRPCTSNERENVRTNREIERAGTSKETKHKPHSLPAKETKRMKNSLQKGKKMMVKKSSKPKTRMSNAGTNTEAEMETEEEYTANSSDHNMEELHQRLSKDIEILKVILPEHSSELENVGRNLIENQKLMEDLEACQDMFPEQKAADILQFLQANIDAEDRVGKFVKWVEMDDDETSRREEQNRRGSSSSEEEENQANESVLAQMDNLDEIAKREHYINLMKKLFPNCKPSFFYLNLQDAVDLNKVKAMISQMFRNLDYPTQEVPANEETPHPTRHSAQEAYTLTAIREFGEDLTEATKLAESVEIVKALFPDCQAKYVYSATQSALGTKDGLLRLITTMWEQQDYPHTPSTSTQDQDDTVDNNSQTKVKV